jgi:NAD(P)-dependent dehydrogenase (short-subunit alcohol dehydrogenase family)
MAAGLLRAGADVAIISSSNAIFDAADMLGQTAGRPVHALQADLSDRTELQQAFEHGVKQLGGLDVLVVNHAIQRRFPAEEFPIEDWDVILETNLTSMFLLNQLAGRVMLSRGQGKIINVASLLSFSGGITVPAYAATKGGVAQLTKALANEWAGQGVNVRPVIWTPTRRRPCWLIPSETGILRNGYRQAGGVNLKICKASSYFWPPRPQLTFTGQSSRLTAGGWPVDISIRQAITTNRRCLS